jgi:cation transport ATPase
MKDLLIISQLIVAISVLFVWVFRFHNVKKEFKQFGLSVTIRSAVGASKIALATLLLVGLCQPCYVFYSAILMGFFMLSAQYFHFRVKNTLQKRIPSFIFLSLCVFIALQSYCS